MRIAFLIGSMHEGGAEGQLAALMRGLRVRGHDIRLMLLRPGGAWMEILENEGFEVHRVSVPLLRPLWNISGKARAVRSLAGTVKYLRQFDPQIFHCWLFEAEAWGALARLAGAPGLFVTTRGNMGYYKADSPWKQLAQDQYNRLTAMAVANAEAIALDALRRERNLSPSRVAVIHNGVDWQRFAQAKPARLDKEIPGWKPGHPVVLKTANLFTYKGHADLIEAWQRVHKAHPDAHLLFAGRDTETGKQLRRQIRRAGLNERVHLLGPRQDIPALLSAADLFVLASHEEGLPNAVVEATAAGLAIVATRVGGVPEAVLHHENGFLVPPRSPEELAKALVRLLEDGELRRQFGAAGQKLARERFSLERLVSDHEALYWRICRRHGVETV